MPARQRLRAGPPLAHPKPNRSIERWHLVRNLREALERLLDQLHQRLAAMLTASQVPTVLLLSTDARSLRRTTTDHIARQERWARRLARSQEVQTLHAQGVSKRHMAQPLQMGRTTVSRSRRTATFPERAQSQRVSVLDPEGVSAPAVGGKLSQWRPTLA